ncbi:50S ribosomal protein L31 [Pasteuria penetrans]|uniref:50S ribosomal protein L31 n=1 Tax=Pasteuria penetrans TaxID=86005 RepID=UPI0011EE9A11|nr:50S ribosomal protein L31 [Pasteuria penetrans]
MRAGLHPEYHTAEVVCACGNEFRVGSTKKSLRIDICSECHPFYTGKQKAASRGGRVERFQKRYNMAGTSE